MITYNYCLSTQWFQLYALDEEIEVVEEEPVAKRPRVEGKHLIGFKTTFKKRLQNQINCQSIKDLVEV